MNHSDDTDLRRNRPAPRKPHSGKLGILRRLRGARRLKADDDGAIIVEFALVSWLFIIMFMGVVELSLALSVFRKITHSAAVMGNVLSNMPQSTRGTTAVTVDSSKNRIALVLTKDDVELLRDIAFDAALPLKVDADMGLLIVGLEPDNYERVTDANENNDAGIAMKLSGTKIGITDTTNSARDVISDTGRLGKWSDACGRPHANDWSDIAPNSATAVVYICYAYRSPLTLVIGNETTLKKQYFLRMRNVEFVGVDKLEVSGQVTARSSASPPGGASLDSMHGSQIIDGT